MKQLKSLSVLLLWLLATLGSINSDARETWDPFKGVSELVVWFDNLNSQFDDIVKAEKTAQILRYIDKLNEALLRVETGTQTIEAELPDQPPDSTESAELAQKVHSLNEILFKAVADQVFHVGVALEQDEKGGEIAYQMTPHLEEKQRALTFLEKMISGKIPWDADEARAQLEQGLTALHAVQDGIRAFRSKLTTVQPVTTPTASPASNG